MPIPEALQAFLNEANSREVSYIPKDVRELTEKITEALALPKLPVPLVTERSFTYADQLIPVRIYHPLPQQTLPVIVYYHGGGHLTGSLTSHDTLVRRIALACECVVVAVGYRLAPEFPYPAGLNDCIAAYENRAMILDDILADVNQVFLAGDSAGGNLALSVAHAVKNSTIQGLALIYPSVDFLMSYDSIQRNGKGYLLTEEKMRWYFSQYFLNGGDPIIASPIHFPSLERLPPLYMAVAEFDPLHDEGVAFAEKVRKLGVSVQLEFFPGMVHVFAQLEKIVPDQVQQLTSSIADFVKNQKKG